MLCQTVESPVLQAHSPAPYSAVDAFALARVYDLRNLRGRANPSSWLVAAPGCNGAEAMGIKPGRCGPARKVRDVLSLRPLQLS